MKTFRYDSAAHTLERRGRDGPGESHDVTLFYCDTTTAAILILDRVFDRRTAIFYYHDFFREVMYPVLRDQGRIKITSEGVRNWMAARRERARVAGIE